MSFADRNTITANQMKKKRKKNNYDNSCSPFILFLFVMKAVRWKRSATAKNSINE